MNNQVDKEKVLDNMLDRLRAALQSAWEATHGEMHLSEGEVASYVGGTLEESESQKVRQHIDQCITCWEGVELSRTNHWLDSQGRSFEPPSNLAEKGWQRVQQRLAEERVVSALRERVQAPVNGQRLSVVRYDGDQIAQARLQTRLMKELNAHAAGNLIEPIATIGNGDAHVWIANTKAANVAQFQETRHSHFIVVVGSSKDLRELIADSIVELPIRWETDRFAVSLPECEAERGEAYAEGSASRFKESLINSPARDAALAVLMHGVLGEVMPVRWLEQAGYITSNPHPVTEKLYDAREVIVPVNPYKLQLADWEKPEYLMAVDENVAWRVLQREEKASTGAFVNHFSRIINAVVTPQLDPKSEDAQLLTRILHTLVLRGHRPIVQGLLRPFSQSREKIDSFVRELQSNGYDYRYLMTWAKIYGKAAYFSKAGELLETARNDANISEGDRAYLCRV